MLGHRAVRILQRATPIEKRDIRLQWSSPRTRDTHTKRLAVELSLPVFMTQVCLDWDSNTQPSAYGANALTDCAAAAAVVCQIKTLLLILRSSGQMFTVSFYTLKLQKSPGLTHYEDKTLKITKIPSSSQICECIFHVFCFI